MHPVQPCGLVIDRDSTDGFKQVKCTAALMTVDQPQPLESFSEGITLAHLPLDFEQQPHEPSQGSPAIRRVTGDRSNFGDCASEAAKHAAGASLPNGRSGYLRTYPPLVRERNRLGWVDTLLAEQLQEML